MGTPQVRAQLAYHNGINELFAEMGLPPAETFVEALEIARQLDLLTRGEQQRLMVLNSEANSAKHPRTSGRWERAKR